MPISNEVEFYIPFDFFFSLKMSTGQVRYPKPKTAAINIFLNNNEEEG